MEGVADGGAIKVVVRFRPVIAKELAREKGDHNFDWVVDSNKIHLKVDGTVSTQAGQNPPGSYVFDRVFDKTTTTADLYDEIAQPLVNSATAGFNSTIFAYGQTSSGKTHTMSGTETEPGIIPAAIDHIFEVIEETPDRVFLIRVTYVEIYNDKIYDLLDSKGMDKKQLSLREDADHNIIVHGATEEVVKSPEEVEKLKKRGDKNRRTAETKENNRSSRSHSVFRVVIESGNRNDPDSGVLVSHFNLVDLAGSEKASENSGERLKEGCNINLSLHYLARIISELSSCKESGKLSSHYFRNSNLCRILQNALGGNAKTAIICTVTPSALTQTISTLRFAADAKCVQNDARVNEVLSESAMLKRAQKDIKKLQQQISEYEQQQKRDQDQSKTFDQIDITNAQFQLEMHEQERTSMQKQIERLKTMICVSTLPAPSQNQPPAKLRRMTWCPGKGATSLPMTPKMFKRKPRENPIPAIEEAPEVDTPPMPETRLRDLHSATDTPKDGETPPLPDYEDMKNVTTRRRGRSSAKTVSLSPPIPMDDSFNNLVDKEFAATFFVPTVERCEIGTQTEADRNDIVPDMTSAMALIPTYTPSMITVESTPEFAKAVLNLSGQSRTGIPNFDCEADLSTEQKTVTDYNLEIKTLQDKIGIMSAELIDARELQEFCKLEKIARKDETDTPTKGEQLIKIRRSVNDYQQINSGLNKEISHLKDERRQFISDMDTIVADVDKQTTTNTKLQAKLELVAGELKRKEAEISTLQNCLDERDTIIEQSKQPSQFCAENPSEIRQNEQKWQAIDVERVKEIAMLKNELENMKLSEPEEIQKLRTELEEQWNLLEIEKNREVEAIKSDLLKERDDFETQRDKNVCEKADLEAKDVEILSLKSDLETERINVSEMLREIQQLKDKSNSVEIEQQIVIENLEEMTQLNEKSHEKSHEKSLEYMQRELENERQKVTENLVEIAQLKEKSLGIEELESELQNEREQMIENMKQKSNQIDELKSELEREREEQKKISQNNIEEASESESLKIELQNMQDEVAKLMPEKENNIMDAEKSDEIEELKMELENERAKVNEHLREIQQLKEKADSVEAIKTDLEMEHQVKLMENLEEIEHLKEKSLDIENIRSELAIERQKTTENFQEIVQLKENSKLENKDDYQKIQNDNLRDESLAIESLKAELLNRQDDIAKLLIEKEKTSEENNILNVEKQNEIDQLKTELKSKDIEFSQVLGEKEDSMEQFREKLDKSKAEVERLNIEMVERQMASLNMGSDDVVALRKDITTNRQKLADLEQTLNEEQKRLTTAQRNNKDLEEELSQKNDKIEELKESLKEMHKSELTDSDQKSDELKEGYVSEEDHKELQSQMSKRLEEIESLKMQLEKFENDDEINQHNTESLVASEDDKHKEVQIKLDEKQEEIESLTIQLEKSKDESNTNHETMTELKTEMSESQKEIESLKKQLATKNDKEINDYNLKELEASEEKYQELQSQMSEKLEEIECLNEQNLISQDELKDLQSQLNERVEEIESLKKSDDKVNQQTLTELQSKMSETLEDMGALKTQLETSKHDDVIKQENLTALQAKYDDLVASQRESTSDGREIKDLKVQLENLTGDMDILQVTNSDLYTTIEEKDDQIEQLNEDMDSLKRNTASDDTADNEQKLEEITEELSQNKQDNCELNEEILHLKKQLEDHKETSAENIEQNDSIFKRVRDELAEKTADYDLQNEEIDLLKEELVIVKEKLSENEEMSRSNADIMAAKCSAESLVTYWEEKYKTLQDELNDKTMKLKDLEMTEVLSFKSTLVPDDSRLLREKVNQLEHDLVIAQDAKELTEKNLEQLENEILTVRQINDDNCVTISENLSQVNALKQQNAALLEDMECEQSDNENMRSEIDDLKLKNTEQVTIIKTLESENHNLVEEVDIFKNENTTRDSDVEMLRERNNEQRNQICELKDANGQLEVDLKSLELKVGEANEEIGVIKSAKDDIISEVDVLKTKNCDLNLELDSLKCENSLLKEDSKQIEKLKNDLEGKVDSTEVEVLKQEIIEKENSAAYLAQKYEVLEQKYLAEVDKSENALHDVSLKHQDLEQKYLNEVEKSENLQVEHEAQIESLQTYIDNGKAYLARLEEEHAIVCEENATEISKLTNELANLEKEHATVRNENASEISRLKHELATLDEKHSTVRDDNTSEISRLTNELARLKEEQATVCDENTSKVRTELDEKAALLSDLQSLVEQNQAQNAKLEATLAEKEKDIVDKQAVIVFLREGSEDKDETLDDIAKENHRIMKVQYEHTAKIQKLEKEKARSNKNAKELQIKVTELQTKMTTDTSIKEEVVKLRSDNERLTDEIVKVDGNLQITQSQLEKSEYNLAKQKKNHEDFVTKAQSIPKTEAEQTIQEMTETITKLKEDLRQMECDKRKEVYAVKFRMERETMDYDKRIESLTDTNKFHEGRYKRNMERIRVFEEKEKALAAAALPQAAPVLKREKDAEGVTVATQTSTEPTLPLGHLGGRSGIADSYRVYLLTAQNERLTDEVKRLKKAARDPSGGKTHEESKETEQRRREIPHNSAHSLDSNNSRTANSSPSEKISQMDTRARGDKTTNKSDARETNTRETSATETNVRITRSSKTRGFDINTQETTTHGIDRDVNRLETSDGPMRHEKRAQDMSDREESTRNVSAHDESDRNKSGRNETGRDVCGRDESGHNVGYETRQCETRTRQKAPVVGGSATKFQLDNSQKSDGKSTYDGSKGNSKPTASNSSDAKLMPAVDQAADAPAVEKNTRRIIHPVKVKAKVYDCRNIMDYVKNKDQLTATTSKNNPAKNTASVVAKPHERMDTTPQLGLTAADKSVATNTSHKMSYLGGIDALQSTNKTSKRHGEHHASIANPTGGTFNRNPTDTTQKPYGIFNNRATRLGVVPRLDSDSDLEPTKSADVAGKTQTHGHVGRIKDAFERNSPESLAHKDACDETSANDPENDATKISKRHPDSAEGGVSLDDDDKENEFYNQPVSTSPLKPLRRGGFIMDSPPRYDAKGRMLNCPIEKMKRDEAVKATEKMKREEALKATDNDRKNSRGVGGVRGTGQSSTSIPEERPGYYWDRQRGWVDIENEEMFDNPDSSFWTSSPDTRMRRMMENTRRRRPYKHQVVDPKVDYELYHNK